MTSSAAARAGIPAVIAEAGGCGQLEEAATAMLVDGVRNVLRHLELLPGEPNRVALARRREVRLVRASQEGWWQPVVRGRGRGRRGQLLGSLRTLYGDVIKNFHAPRDGVVLFLTTSPAVSADVAVLGLGAELLVVRFAIRRICCGNDIAATPFDT